MGGVEYFDLNASDKLAEYLNIEPEELIEVAVVYDCNRDYDGDIEVEIGEIYLYDEKYLGAKEITDCFDNKDFQYFEERIIEGGVEC